MTHRQSHEENENQNNIHDSKRYGETDHVDTNKETSDLDHGHLTENEESPESASKPHGDEGIHDDKRYGETDHVDTDEETSNLDPGHLTENNND